MGGAVVLQDRKGIYPLENTSNNIEFETREQYHARCEERKRLAAERARRQLRQRALLGGGCALIFVAIIGAVIGIRVAVASAHSAGSGAEQTAVSLAETTTDALDEAGKTTAEAGTVIAEETVPTEESLTAEVKEYELAEGPEEATAEGAEDAASGENVTNLDSNAEQSTTAAQTEAAADQATTTENTATNTAQSTGVTEAVGSSVTTTTGSYTPLNPVSGGDLLPIPEEVISEHAVLISLEDEAVRADLGMNDRISPASMTKVLTLLTAVENFPESWQDDTFTMTINITDYSYVNDCSNVGFEVGEEIPIKDLLYGTILPSGADAALGLANYVAGSHEAFVELMNAKIKELGLSATTHFTNCVGLYNEDHYTTCRDMAIIMKAAMDNPLCRDVLSTHVYTTSPTTPHPDGLILSNWFLRRIEDKDCGGFVVGAKTGFVVQSKCCAVSLAQGPDNKEYILVTAGSTSSWRAIYDQVAIYKAYFTLSDLTDPLNDTGSGETPIG